MKAILIVAVSICIFFGFMGDVAGFGSVKNKDTAVLVPGEIANFKILFYNLLQKDSVNLELTAFAPEGWIVQLSSNELTLEKTEVNDLTGEDGVEYISSPIGYIKAHPVFITAIPATTQPGDYTIRILAEEVANMQGIAVVQRRNFYFTVSIVTESQRGGTTGSDTYHVEDSQSDYPATQPGILTIPWVYVIMIVVILGVLIYFARRRQYNY